MKKLIIMTGLLTLTSIIYCQSFILENKTWNVVECMNFGGCGTHSFKISGDTTIGQVDYKKLYSTYDSLINWSIYGAMRENENQVFIYNFYHESEELLYDFKLSVGDTFSTTVNTPDYNGCPIELLVTSIDTIILENGESKQRFNFTDGEQWIYGIGSLNGIVYVGVYWCIFDMYYELSCCHENDELIFQSSGFDNCFINTVGINESITQIKYSIFPNPSTSNFTIQFTLENKEQVKLAVMNNMGQVVEIITNETVQPGKHELYWSAEGMPAGVYFYNIQIGKQAGTGKLVLMK